MPSTSTELIEKYFAEPSTQAIIQETENIRQEAYNAKQVFYKKYRRLVWLIYVIIVGGLVYWISEFWFSEDFWKIVLGLLIAPWAIFSALANTAQTAILTTKKAKTNLFDSFIKYVIPWSQFNETKDLYIWDPLASDLFIKDISSHNSHTTQSNSFTIPLVYTQEKTTSVYLEGIEVEVEQTKWTWNNERTITDMGMLYKIYFTTPKRTITQSVKIIADSNSWFKNKENLVSLENQEFEKYFDVYTADPIEARMILTPNVMDKLAQFIKATWAAYSFNLVDNIFYIKHTLYTNTWTGKTNIQISGIDLSALSESNLSWLSKEENKSLINIDRDNSIEQNKEIYKAFYNEILYIQQLVEALNIDYFNKLS